MDMIEALNTPSHIRNERPILNPNVPRDLLKNLYQQFAKILLQLSKLEFPLTGALKEIKESSWEVTRRPPSLPMNELVRLGTLPQHKLPITTFGSSSEYFPSLAALHIDHLAAQRNNAVDSKADCRRKYVTRHLFQKLSHDRRLSSPKHDNQNNHTLP